MCYGGDCKPIRGGENAGGKNEKDDCLGTLSVFHGALIRRRAL